MRRPPEPHYAFTLPSIHDDTTLDCRIYHPDAVNEAHAAQEEVASQPQQWQNRGVVMAHPYAPMGGSYDDRVVGIVVEEFVKLGWIVGTFNFRGAHGSKGHTSWSGKAELEDYTSFAAFFIHYMAYLQQVPESSSVEHPPVSSPSALSKPPTKQSEEDSGVIVLGGYSYGSLMVKHLPPLPTIIQPFVSPVPGSAAHEILLRAQKLADQSNQEWIDSRRSFNREKEASKKRHEPKHSMAMGGEETDPDKRRTSKEIRRSIEGRSIEGRRSHDIAHRFIRSHSHKTPPKSDAPPQTVPEEEKPASAISMPNIRYLLISPLTPPVSTLAAPALAPGFWNRSRDGAQEVIGKYPSLAVYGDQDIFASTKKIHHWVKQINATPGSQLTSVEVQDAGHFWVERGVEEKLRCALREWEAEVRG